MSIIAAWGALMDRVATVEGTEHAFVWTLCGIDEWVRIPLCPAGSQLAGSWITAAADAQTVYEQSAGSAAAAHAPPVLASAVSFTCAVWSPGSTQPRASQLSCPLCDTGFMSNVSAATHCIPCAAGWTTASNGSSAYDVRLPVDEGDAPASNSSNSALSSVTMALIALGCAVFLAGALLAFVLWRRGSARRPPPAAAKGVAVRVQQVQRPQAQAPARPAGVHRPSVQPVQLYRPSGLMAPRLAFPVPLVPPSMAPLPVGGQQRETNGGPQTRREQRQTKRKTKLRTAPSTREWLNRERDAQHEGE
jgi:hypothetical protein